MRALLILVVVVCLMALGGWLVFDFGDSSASVQVNTGKIEEDAERAVEAPKDVLRKAGEAIGDVDDPEPIEELEEPA